MRRVNSGILAIALIFTSCTSNKLSVEWVESTPASQWQAHQIELKNQSEITKTAIVIYPDKKQQSIDGFGGCFNELGWEALNMLNDQVKQEILKSLFDTVTGCKFNICRMPIGANDYAVDWYSFDESPGDFGMDHFSIERDSLRLIPYIKSALNYNPRLKMWASPWCPPSWMKTNNHYVTKLVTYNPEYYLMKHFSYFIPPGAYKLECSDENCLAFINSDSTIIEYYNPWEKTIKKFLIGNLRFEAELSGKSFNTFKIKM